jgi:hypothetical protein
MARRVMKNDFAEYLEYLNEDGSISESPQAHPVSDTIRSIMTNTARRVLSTHTGY